MSGHWKSSLIAAGVLTAVVESTRGENERLTFGHMVSEIGRYVPIIPIAIWASYSTPSHIHEKPLGEMVFDWTLIALIALSFSYIILGRIKPKAFYLGQKAVVGWLIDSSVFPFDLPWWQRVYLWYFWVFAIPEQVASFLVIQMLVQPGFQGTPADFREVMAAYRDGRIGALLQEYLNSPFPDEYDEDVPMDWTRTSDEWTNVQKKLYFSRPAVSDEDAQEWLTHQDPRIEQPWTALQNAPVEPVRGSSRNFVRKDPPPLRTNY